MEPVLSQTAHRGLFLYWLGCLTAWTGGCAQSRTMPACSQPIRQERAHGYFPPRSAHTESPQTTQDIAGTWCVWPVQGLQPSDVILHMITGPEPGDI